MWLCQWWWPGEDLVHPLNTNLDAYLHLDLMALSCVSVQPELNFI